jgi:hypothetical protein
MPAKRVPKGLEREEATPERAAVPDLGESHESGNSSDSSGLGEDSPRGKRV